MSAIDDILELLEDGNWHDISEAVKKSKLHESKVEIILGFLAKYRFVDFDEEQQKAKLTPPLLKFLKEIQRFKKKDVLSS